MRVVSFVHQYHAHKHTDIQAFIARYSIGFLVIKKKRLFYFNDNILIHFVYSNVYRIFYEHQWAKLYILPINVFRFDKRKSKSFDRKSQELLIKFSLSLPMRRLRFYLFIYYFFVLSWSKCKFHYCSNEYGLIILWNLDEFTSKNLNTQ